MSDYRYQHLIRQDCPLPAATHVIVYCRDSGGEEQDRSIAQQTETAHEYCERHHLVLERVYADESRLSSNTDKRDQLREMLFDLRRRFKPINDRYKREKAREEKPFGIIFWKSSRLGRDSIESTHIKTDLRMRGITLVDLVTSANTGNAAIDGLIEAFQQWQDEQALDEISHNAKRGLAQLISTRDTDPEFLRCNPEWKSTGGYLGIMPGGVPRGFHGDRIQIGVYKRKKGRAIGEPRIVQRLVPDNALWGRCRLAWEMRHSGASYGEIHAATRLFKNINGYDTFFRNRIYTGDLRYGDAIYEDFVPAMIPREWWEAEQARREEHANKLKGKQVRREVEPGRIGSEYLLSGLVHCGCVDGEEHPMRIESIPAKKGKRSRYTFFYCTVAKNSRKTQCQAKRISVRYLDELVIDALMTHIITPENLRPLAENLADSLATRTQDATLRINALEEQLQDVQKAISNLVDAIERGKFDAHLQERYDARKQQEEQLQHELQAIKALEMDSGTLDTITGATLEKWISSLRHSLHTDKVTARRMLQQFIERIVVGKEAGRIVYSFPLPEDTYISSFQHLDLRDGVLKTRYDQYFPIPLHVIEARKQFYSDKLELRDQILEMYQRDMSLREIGTALDIHWTRIQQIINAHR